jgi:two-component sensor histidine kinase
VNELVSNALKHGFRDGQTGTISVVLRATSHRDLSLVVADDGDGLPGGYTLEKARSLGHQLVLTLVRQLGGRIELANGRGVRFEISFGQHMSGENRAIDLGG